jgi:hypothetical protein
MIRELGEEMKIGFLYIVIEDSRELTSKTFIRWDGLLFLLENFNFVAHAQAILLSTDISISGLLIYCRPAMPFSAYIDELLRHSQEQILRSIACKGMLDHCILFSITCLRVQLKDYKMPSQRIKTPRDCAKSTSQFCCFYCVFCSFCFNVFCISFDSVFWTWSLRLILLQFVEIISWSNVFCFESSVFWSMLHLLEASIPT